GILVRILRVLVNHVHRCRVGNAGTELLGNDAGAFGYGAHVHLDLHTERVLHGARQLLELRHVHLGEREEQHEEAHQERHHVGKRHDPRRHARAVLPCSIVSLCMSSLHEDQASSSSGCRLERGRYVSSMFSITRGFWPDWIDSSASMISDLRTFSSRLRTASLSAIGRATMFARMAPYKVVSSAMAIAGPICLGSSIFASIWT